MNTKWKLMAVCECGMKAWCPFGDLFHVHCDVCPECGAKKSTFRIKTMRWVFASKWWNPLTWNDGFWETKGESIENNRN